MVPTVYFDRAKQKPVVKFCLFLSRPDEALRFGRSHVGKDGEIGPLPAKHIVNIPDIEEWKTQRRHMSDAFLPLGPITASVGTLEKMSDEMILKWRQALSSATSATASANAQGLPLGPNQLDVREWMHHTAFGMFVACMLGDDRAFSPAVEDPLSLDVDLYSDYEEDVSFLNAVPLNSLPARSLFNLEDIGNSSSPKVQQKKFIKALGYVGKLITRGEERQEHNQAVGPLMERILELKTEEKIANTLATLVAGHDTTAYTMQFTLMELAKQPKIQDRVRKECQDILHAIQLSGRALEYSDLPRFELLTKCICETLRMWNVAAIVFPRVTSFEDQLIGSLGGEEGEGEGKEEGEGDNRPTVTIPKGTKFSFWYYGQHHSTELWGEDAMEWNPDRDWHPYELQRSIDPNDALWENGKTPCTSRFHPFSVPTRDCLGKNFAMTEMRVLLPRILCNFQIDIPQGSELMHVQPREGDPVYDAWSRTIGGPCQPHAMNLQLTPLEKPLTPGGGHRVSASKL